VKKLTRKNAKKVFDRILAMREHENHSPIFDDILKAFNDALDDLHGNDCFGTEGQVDPRGDHRECC